MSNFQQVYIETLIQQAKASPDKLPTLGIIYGTIQKVQQNPDWTFFEVFDDTGTIAVYIPSQMIHLSSSIVDELILINNRSGKTVLFWQNEMLCVNVQDPKDIATRNEAFELQAQLCSSPPAEVTSNAAASVLETVTETAVALASASETPSPPLPEVVTEEEVKEAIAYGEQNPDNACHLSEVSRSFLNIKDKNARCIAQWYSSCLDTATLVIAEHVRRFPEHISLLEPRSIKDTATTMFIQMCYMRKGR